MQYNLELIDSIDRFNYMFIFKTNWQNNLSFNMYFYKTNYSHKRW